METRAKILMFTDQVESTPGTMKRTHAEVAEVKREQVRLTVAAVGRSRGTILKDTGDGDILEFQSFRDAVQCGCLLQEYVRERNENQEVDNLKFELHVGIDYGDIVRWENDDVSGMAADQAARVCSKCEAGEVYFTESVFKKLKPNEFEVDKVGTRTLKGIGKVTLYRIAKCHVPLDPPLNPFVWRGGITVAEDFFGREKELANLEAYLAGAQSQNCQVVGPRRIGKSSLLLHIQRLAPKWLDSFVPVYVDLQDARCETLKGFLGLLGSRFGWPSVPKNMAEATECFEAMIREKKRPLLYLDEFERMMKNHGKFGGSFLTNLRACGQMGVSIVTATKKPLNEVVPADDLSSPYFNAFGSVDLGPFAQGEAEDFVNYYRPGVERFSEEEREAILSFSQRHPQALQVACFHVLNAKRTGELLESAIKKAGQDMKNHLPGEW